MPKTRNDQELLFPEFEGFDTPEQNWFRMPNNWTDITARITNIAELKVVEYILRHTWGYQEYNIKKRITMDEFVHGRKRQDGSRMDSGTGLSERAVRYGILSALKHGLIEEEVDDSDRGRIKKYYCLKMRHGGKNGVDKQDLQPGVQSLHPGVQDVHLRGAEFTPRTEKETIERNFKKDIYPSNIRKAKSDGFDYVKSERGGEEPEPSTPSSAENGGASQKSQPDKTEEAVSLNTTGQTQIRTVEELEGIEKFRRSAANRSGNNQPSPTGEQKRRGGLAHIGQTLHSRLPTAPSTVEDTVAREAIERYIRDIAAKLHDEAPLKSSASRAFNLYRQTGADLSAFFNLLYDAEKEANRRSATIKKVTSLGFKNRMAYFFAILEDMLGLRPQSKISLSPG